jgi:[protein-PII] uridylyltransferase
MKNQVPAESSPTESGLARPDVNSFVPPADSKQLVAEIRAFLERHRGTMAAVIRGELPCADESPGHGFSRAVDGVLSALFIAANAARRSQRHPKGLSMGAVGSYGRRTLSYHSDLDIRILADDEGSAQAVSEALLYPLWDAGVAIGHQGVTIAGVIELARSDLPTATSLLDWRPIAGDDAMIGRLSDKAFSALFGLESIQRFLEPLLGRVNERVERYGGSVYLLEPDVRNGAGGMRDYDVVHWIARARFRVQHPRDLVEKGVVIQREWEPIERAAKFLWQVRNLLHLLSGRRNDRLSFERQEQVALALGYGNDGHAVEQFMSEYYRHARVLTQARDMMFLRAAPPSTRRIRETRLGNGLRLLNRAVAFKDQLGSEPVLALRLYSEAVRRGARVHPDSRTEVMQATSLPAFCEALRKSEEAAKLFVKLVTWVGRSAFAQGSVVEELHDVGLLTAMIPEFIPVVGRVHHDIYHVYTVDAHSLKAVDRLRALSRGELASEHPIASHLAAEIVRPNVLFFAALLHDLGKDIGGIDHGERSAVLADAVLRRLHLGSSEIREVQHLAAKHLEMYHIATRRDIEDPLTLEEFCREVHSHEGLRELYLLTLCDVATTSPESLTSWKARMLDELYLAAEARLGNAQVDVDEAREAVRNDVVRLWSVDGDAAPIRQFLQSMPERYSFANDPAHIVVHARFALDNQGARAKVRAVNLEPPYGEFAFLADDRPGLLALIAASIAAAHVQVIAAQIYSFVDERGRPRALDLFWVNAGDRIRTGRTLANRFEQNLMHLLDQGVESPEFVAKLQAGGRWSSRVTPAVATTVSIDNRGATHETVLEVITRDRPGLLFELASTIQRAGLVISLAKINTEGHQVADVFYVTEPGGGKVTDPLRLAQLKDRIRTAVGSD